MIPNIGPLEIAIVLIVALLVFGPKKLPELGRSAGKGLSEFRSGLSGRHEEEKEIAAEGEPAEPTKAGTA